MRIGRQVESAERVCTCPPIGGKCMPAGQWSLRPRGNRNIGLTGKSRKTERVRCASFGMCETCARHRDRLDLYVCPVQEIENCHPIIRPHIGINHNCAWCATEGRGRW